jgi:SAM-dependent methyltransferase
MQAKTLDLGCGRVPQNPFQAQEVFGIDILDSPDGRIRRADLAIESIPFEDGMFDFVTAFDFLEHIPRLLYCPHRRNAFVELMSDIYRVLKPSGIFLSKTPAYPHAPAFMDPTHVNVISEGTFSLYFADAQPDSPWAILYGFRGAFKLVSEQWQGPHLVTVLQKIPLADAPAYRNGHAALPQ